MASQSFLKIGIYQYGGSQRRINDPQAEIFNSTDLIADEIRQDGEAHWSYRITVGELRRRLETLGYTLEQVRRDIVTTLAKGYDNLDEYDRPIFKEFLDYGTNVTIQELIDIVGTSLRRNPVFLDFDFGSRDDFPGALLDFINGDQPYLIPDDRIFLSGLYYERLACEHCDHEDFYELDFTELVRAGYYRPYDQPLGDNYDEALSRITPNSFRLGQTLLEEESETLEFKSIEAANPSKAIAQQIARYAIGFLNRSGGRILFGVSDQGTVEGIAISRADRDKLQQQINQSLAEITPAFPVSDVTIQFCPLISIAREVPEKFVVEVTVPTGRAQEMYFKGNDTWVRIGTETKFHAGHQLFVHICARYSTADQLLTALDRRVQIAKQEIDSLRQEGERHSGELAIKISEMQEMQRTISETAALLKQTDLVCPKCGAPIQSRHFHTITSPDGEQGHDIEIIVYECGHDLVKH